MTRLEKEAEEYALKAQGSHPDDEEDRKQCAFNFIDGWRACRAAMLAAQSGELIDLETFGEEEEHE